MPPASVAVLHTGMGRANAVRTARAAVERQRPECVLTCGFAGGLRPDLTFGTVLYSADPALNNDWDGAFRQAGAVAGDFFCAPSVAVTAQQKRDLWAAHGADAVDMESQAIRELCQEMKIPSATLRVISDAADENLPLDFNALMNDRMEIRYGQLAWFVVSHPWVIPKLVRLQRRTQEAARRLGTVLENLLGKQGLALR